MSIVFTQMPNSKKIIILGIDPGLAETGYGLISKEKGEDELIDYGCIHTSSKDEFASRLLAIHKKIKKLIERYKPDYLVIEELFFAKNVKSALKVGQACGVVILTASQAKVPVMSFTPLQIKQGLASYGRADKYQIQKMVQILLNLKELPEPSHAADALAAALCASQSLKLNELAMPDKIQK